MIKVLLLVIMATGEPKVFTNEQTFPTMEACEAFAAANAPGAIVALGGVAGQWACVPAGIEA